MEIYNKAEKFTLDAWEKAEKPNDVIHSQRTVYWVKQLKPDAEEALLVAAVAHDIERAVYGDWKKGSDDPEALRKHQDQSAKVIGKFLKDEGAGENFIEKVKHLVANHEVGGDEEQNVLCDADCLAFFEEKALRRVKKWKAQEKTKEEIKNNMDFYFSRIISQKAKDIAKEWYEEVLREIEK